MKRMLLSVVCVGLVVLGVSASASAFSYEIRTGNSRNYSGDYLFTVLDPINDNIDNVEKWNEEDLGEFIDTINDRIFALEGITDYITELEFYGKYESEGFTGEEFNVDFTGDTFGESYTGSWKTLDGTNIEFYTVKAATEFAVYWMGQGGASAGSWSTEHLSTGQTIPTISHLSLWNPSDPGMNPIPEPSTVFLLGLGLFGVLGLGRKFKK